MAAKIKSQQMSDLIKHYRTILNCQTMVLFIILKKNKQQTTDLSIIKAGNHGNNFLQQWKMKRTDKKNFGKKLNFIKSTKK